MSRFVIVVLTLSFCTLLHDSFADQETPNLTEHISGILDQLHDAASKADAERYFSLFAPDAVFLGTDASERWTLDAFRTYALEHFKKGVGWTYRVQHDSRFISINKENSIAWFDELLDNSKYGVCRGSGVLRKLDGTWRIAQYNLAIPVPNNLAPNVVNLIRRNTQRATKLVLIRNAEQTDVSRMFDPELSKEGKIRAQDLLHAVGSVKFDAIYVSQFTGTKQTVAMVAEMARVQPTMLDVRKIDDLASRIKNDHVGQTVLVCGSSWTITTLLTKLNLDYQLHIDKGEYDNLIITVLHPCLDGELIHLHYGDE